ncbi:MAG: helix-turn-helix transcriptional regulator [Flavobacterium sp.]|nr:helix-turn-helix transcriptional regulator [Candidatus Neoflavobacterium equi]
MAGIIGRNITIYREKLGLTQEQISRYLDKNLDTIRDYENGYLVVPMNVLVSLSHLYSIDAYDFLKKMEV